MGVLEKTKTTDKESADQIKGAKQILFGAKQQGLKYGRERFFEFGELAVIEFDVPINKRLIRLQYRYDPLNDSLIPIA
ncbi:hypothetical protein [Spirosoma foliorum]|uniref:Uncharacterized protein n=1 Tax=Spirosoma foliorum TaxID=2710596 RepID=A0A7G5H5I3_9BACT|nr:hypothetical protein [Spirosoma foliorum]QMW06375.1 hypothetical protein H3H32_16530 [Spirosoma foliorum]